MRHLGGDEDRLIFVRIDQRLALPPVSLFGIELHAINRPAPRGLFPYQPELIFQLLTVGERKQIVVDAVLGIVLVVKVLEEAFHQPGVDTVCLMLALVIDDIIAILEMTPLQRDECPLGAAYGGGHAVLPKLLPRHLAVGPSQSDAFFLMIEKLFARVFGLGLIERN